MMQYTTLVDKCHAPPLKTLVSYIRLSDTDLKGRLVLTRRVPEDPSSLGQELAACNELRMHAGTRLFVTEEYSFPSTLGPQLANKVSASPHVDGTVTERSSSFRYRSSRLSTIERSGSSNHALSPSVCTSTPSLVNILVFVLSV